jgi:hypothetical protein
MEHRISALSAAHLQHDANDGDGNIAFSHFARNGRDGTAGKLYYTEGGYYLSNTIDEQHYISAAAGGL